jgi:hypothetical protein
MSWCSSCEKYRADYGPPFVVEVVLVGLAVFCVLVVLVVP